MNNIINIFSSKYKHINFLSNDDSKQLFGKGWSYSFVYSLTELRDIFIAIEKNGLSNGISHFTSKNIINKVPYTKSEWDNRRVLEVTNALKNFGLLDSRSIVIRPNIFGESRIGDDLSVNDRLVFTEIFFDYFRFKELASLFVNPEIDKYNRESISTNTIIKNSIPLFSFISKKGYVDSFFYKLNNNPDLYVFPDFNEAGDNNSGLKRFWDVFISWGQQLDIIERFNMKNIGFKLSNEKTFNCNYFISSRSCNVSIVEFIRDHYEGETCIDLANLVLRLCLEYRIKVEDAHNLIISFYLSNMENVSLIRTSEIFIKEKDFSKNDRVLYPKYHDSFVSHIKIRR